jgi:eukaryotic-like serine/threonine-protein kinase
MLVMHRDLKPSNILVPNQEGSGLSGPKVIDFGVARLLDAADLDRTCWTLTGEILGTFNYMSPEQAEGDPAAVNVSADVFSLGAVLYELLVGAPPLAALRRLSRESAASRRLPRRDDVWIHPRSFLTSLEADELAVRATLCSTTPAALLEILASDLGAVVMKACRADLSARYSSMAELEEDLRAWLDDKPVRALPPSPFYLLRKYVKRHRAAFTSLAVAGLSCIIAAALILRYAGQARSAERSAVRDKGLAEERKKEAEAAASAARTAQLEAEASSKLLLKALNSPFPTQHGRDVTVLQVLDQAVAELRADSVLPPNRRTPLLHTLGSIFYAHSRYSSAADVLEESVRLRRLLYGFEHPNTLWESLLLARSWIYTGRRPQALNLAEDSLRVIISLDHPESRNLEDTARDLKMSCLYYLHDHERGVAFGRECVERSRSLHGADHPVTLRFMDELAAQLPGQGLTDEAVILLEAILPKIREKMATNDSKAAIVSCRPATLYLDQGRPEKALPLTTEAFAYARRVFTPAHGLTCFFTQNHVITLLALSREAEALSITQAWLAEVESMNLRTDEQSHLAKEARAFLERSLPDTSAWAPICIRLTKLAEKVPAQPEQEKITAIVPAPAVLTFDLRRALLAGVGPGHSEKEVMERLPAPDWKKSAAERPDGYRLTSPRYRGLEFTFRHDGVLVRTRVDLTTNIVKLTPDLGKDPTSAVVHFGKPMSDEIEPGISRLLTFRHQGLEWRIKKDLVADRIGIVSLSAPFWTSNKSK